ncbi:hypothetical protein [Mycobacteroides salmoniphilum]|uniref:hypothetical protein n=1 Tax=Mycobacteroides salmoniphilum TaxID=404941 RepID=UPI0039E18046
MRKWIAPAVIALLLGGLGAFAFKKLSTRCADPDTFAVAADAAIASAISKVAGDATLGGASRVARNADEIPNIVTDLIRARTAAH